MKNLIPGAVLRRFMPGLAVLLVSCAGTPAAPPEAAQAAPPPPPPEWVLQMDAYYPASRYIAQQGTGKTRQEAELNAFRAISYFFSSGANMETSSRFLSVTENGELASESLTVGQNISVTSNTELFAVRYADDPWYNNTAGEWNTVGYIEREEAWTIYEPEAKKVSDALLALNAAAENDPEPFSRALRYEAAAAYIERDEYKGARDFSQKIHPVNANALFGDADSVAAAMTEKMYSARKEASVFIECSSDSDGILYQAAVEAFSAEGFPVERSRDAASAVCAIQVDEGVQKADSGVMYYPALTGTVNGKKSAVFSFSATAARQGALNPDLARRRAYTALAAALKEGFGAELSKKRSSL